jgi:ribonucleoside-diphosphate reductase alpha chain
MNAVEKGEDYLLRWPVDTVFDEGKFLTDEYPYDTLINITDKISSNKTVYIKKVNAKTLWGKLVHCAWNTAEPGVIFIDKMHNYAPDGVYENYKMISTNPCGEIGMNKDSCRLIAMNLVGYVKNPYTTDAEFDFELFNEHTYKAVKLGDDLVDLELEQVNKILSGLNDDDVSEREIWTILRDTAIDVRRMGLGFTGLGDMLAMMGYKYGTTESTTFLENVLKVWFGEQLRGTIKLARMRGTFKKFDANLEGGSDFNTPQNDFFKMIHENYNEEWQEMMKYGMQLWKR